MARHASITTFKHMSSDPLSKFVLVRELQRVVNYLSSLHRMCNFLYSLLLVIPHIDADAIAHQHRHRLQ
jgi:hypothetical protein